MRRERDRPPDDISPAEFFTRWVGQAVAADPERRARLGETDATLEFDLTGDGGGVFTVRIADGVVTGVAGPANGAELRIRVDVDTWRQLNRGEIGAPEALLRRRIHIHGSFLLALKLHLILG
jgi:putative sterol carrier protein